MNTNSEMAEPRVTGQMSKQVEELKKGIDARDLIGRFRNKADIYEYSASIVSDPSFVLYQS